MILLAMLAAAAAPSCANAVSQTDMNLCAAAAGKRAEAALNAQWKRLMAASGGKDAGMLAAQRLWIRFRDAECTAEAAAYQGGSMQPMVHANCYADLAEERAKRLKSLAEDAER